LETQQPYSAFLSFYRCQSSFTAILIYRHAFVTFHQFYGFHLCLWIAQLSVILFHGAYRRVCPWLILGQARL
jgi:hypothetical protein